MAKFIADSAFDAALAYLSGNATELHVLDAAPADRAAVLANSLGSVAIDSGDFTAANGDASGRKTTVASQSITITGSGNVNHAAIISGTELLGYTQTDAAQAVVAAEVWQTPAFDFEITDAV